MKIIVLGDVGASENNKQAFCVGEKDLFSYEIQNLCEEADLVMLNLEKPLTNVITPLGKCPPDFAAPTETINGIKLLNPHVVTLANNHIMDQREQGLQSTKDILKMNNILYVGAGSNTIEARKPLIVTKQNVRVGIYACCEKEFSFASETEAGANAFDPIESLDDIIKLKESCDYLIVLYHGGMQDYPYPTPYQQRICRKMCEKGADLVVCQHSHIIGCEETYANGRIIYGQGNFLLDETLDESWRTGLIIEINIDLDENSINYIPVKTYNHKVIIHPNSDSIKNTFFERSVRITNTNEVHSIFSDFSKTKLSEYLVKLSGKGRTIQRIFRRVGITKHYQKLYSRKACNMILDYLYCDSHRETIEYGLQQFISEKERRSNYE